MKTYKCPVCGSALSRKHALGIIEAQKRAINTGRLQIENRTSDFIAYHSVRTMGYDCKPTKNFRFISRKPESFLRRAIGSRVWVVVGTCDRTRTNYRLDGVFTPSKVQSKSDGYLILGTGTPFRPPFEVTASPWFAELLREQNKFSFGFNRIRGESIVVELQRLLHKYQRTNAAGSGSLRSKLSGGEMKALTLRPSWAWLVVNGYKDIENRSWATRLRGRIWIHASSSPVTHAEYEDFVDICRERRIKKFPAREDFQTGGIVGSAEIVDCVTRSRSYWFHRGDYGFVLSSARRTRFKPMKGMLGFFEVKTRKRRR